MKNSAEETKQNAPIFSSISESPSRALVVQEVKNTGTRANEIVKEAELIEDVQFFLDNSPESTLPRSLTFKSRTILNSAISYLKTPTGNFTDIERHSLALGFVWKDEGHIDAVRNLNLHFIELLYAYHNVALQAELMEVPQDMMKITKSFSTLRGLAERGLKLPNWLSADSPLRSDFEGFLQRNEMRLCTGGEMPPVSSADSAPVIAAVQDFLKTGETDGAIDRALAYLRAPTGNPADLMKLGDGMGELIGMTYMGEGPPAIEALNTHILRLQFEYEFTKLRVAIMREPQDMKEVSASLVLTRNLALSSKSADPTQLQELETFLQAYEIRKKP